MLANNSTEQLVIVGPGMGGQISRYALRDMELRGINHNCRLWVSFDSPHNGAWVPVGPQQMVRQLANSNNNEKQKMFLEAWINCSAAKQMTIHHHLSNSQTTQGTPGFFNRYYDEINDPAFRFPQAAGLRKIAMLSGSDLGVAMPYGQACQETNKFEVKVKPRGFWNWLVNFVVPGIPAVIGIASTQTHHAFLAPAYGTCLSYTKETIFGTVVANYITAPSFSNTTLDMTQGGEVPVFRFLHDELAKANQDLYSFWEKFVTASSYNYVTTGNQEPTYSTIALGRGSAPDFTRKWDANFRKDKFNQPCDVTCPETKESPFDMYWAPDINTRHDSLLLGHVVRLRKEIIDKQEWPKTQIQRTAVITENKILLCTGETATYSVTNPLSNMSYNWTPSSTFL